MTHLHGVLCLELEPPAYVEAEGEEDEGDQGDGAHVLVRAHVRVAHRHVPLDRHRQGAVDGACKVRNK